MNRQSALGAAFCAIALTAACGGQSPTASTDQAATDQAGSAAQVWALDGDGTADPGTHDLSFTGPHTIDDNGATFTGTGYAATTAPGPVTTTESFTVAAWVSFSPSLDGAPYAAAVSQLGTTAAAFFLGLGEGEWGFSMKDADTNDPGHTIRALGGIPEAEQATWVHLVGVHNQEADTIELYLDGRPAARTAFSAPWQATGPLTVGRSQAHGGPADFWPGTITDVRTFTTALTAAQVADLTDQTRPTSPPAAASASPSALSVVNGTYEYTYTSAESKQLEEAFGAEAAAAGFPGEASVTVRFLDGQWQQYVSVDGAVYAPNGTPEGDRGTYTVEGDHILLSNGHDPTATYAWALENDVLSLTLVEYPGSDVEMVRFMTEHDYTRTAQG